MGVLRACGMMPTNAEVEVMRQEADPNGSGKFGQAEAHALLERRQLVIELGDLVKAFAVFDDSGDGKVPMGVLKEMLCSMGEKLSDEEWNKFAAVADPKAEGACDYKNFKM